MDGSSIHDEGPKTPATYGAGSITQDKRDGRWRLRFRNGGDRSRYFDTLEEAELVRSAYLQIGNADQGMTLRQWFEVFLDEHDFGPSYRWTWNSVIVRACPFIDRPMSLVVPNDVVDFAERLLVTPKTRSEQLNGKRTLVTLTESISRSYAKGALSIVRTALEAAKNRTPQLIPSNPADGIKLPNKHKKNGKVRTKRAKKSRVRLDFLSAHDCERIFYCEHCAAHSGIPRHDLEQLVRCEHVPFFYRVALSCSVMQGLREGEIASQRWERIARAGQVDNYQWQAVEWSGKPDWSGHVWLVETSWHDETKNGQDRIQALIPMAARLLHRWWEFKGRPTTGLVFCTADAKSKGSELGELAKFVAAHPDLTNDALLHAAEAAGVPLTRRRVETLRSEARRRTARKAAQQHQMFAKGYDFGWSDTPFKVDGERRVKPGWCTKLDISKRSRFHDFRDTAASHLLSGTWGKRWELEDVSEFLGHSDIKVTRDRYASVTTHAKAELAAGVQPCSLTDASPTPPELPPPTAASALDSGRKVAGDILTSPYVTTENHSAPELGLEPRTTRLTADANRHDYGQLHAIPATLRPVQKPETLSLAKRVLEAAINGGPIKAPAIALAGAVLEDGEEEAAAHPTLRLVK
jgi:integrase